MLKREGTLALFVDITLFTGDIIEGGVGLGFYRWKANTGNKEQQSIDIDAMRNQAWMTWQVK